MQRPRQKQIVLGGALVAYYEARENKPGTPAVVFLHGWRSQGSVWFPVWEKLLGQGSEQEKSFPFALYALDLPGFGGSETARDAYTPLEADQSESLTSRLLGEKKQSGLLTGFTLADYAGVVEEFVKKLGLAEVVLVGHSFGGRVAINVAAIGKMSLQKLVLVGSAGFRSRGVMFISKRVIAKILKPLFLFSFMQPLRRKLYTLIGAQDYMATPALRETFLSTIREDVTPLLPKIQMPTLLVWGENDRVDTPVSFGERMRSAIPGAKLVVLKNAGHFCFLDQTEVFARELVSFLH